MYLKNFQVQLRTLVNDFRVFENRRLRLEEISRTLEPYSEAVKLIELELVRLQSSVFNLENKRDAFRRKVERGNSSSISIDELWEIEDELEKLQQRIKVWKIENKDAFKFYSNTYIDLSAERNQLLPEYENAKNRLNAYLAYANLFCSVTYLVNDFQETRILVPFTKYGCDTYLDGEKFLSTTTRLGGLILAQPIGKMIDDIELGRVRVNSVTFASLETYNQLIDSNMWFESQNFNNESKAKESNNFTYVLDHSYRPYFNNSAPQYDHGRDPARQHKGG